MKITPINLFFYLLIINTLSSCTSTQRIRVKTIEKTIRDTVYLKEISKVNDKIYESAVLKNYNINTNSIAKGQDFRVKFLILHYTVSDYPTAKRILTERNVSAHYLVNDNYDKEIDLLVSEDARAWHAGVSYWDGRTNLNDSSIGIEIVNRGYVMRAGEKSFFEFPSYQIEKVAALAKNIIERYDIAPEYVLGHSDIAPNRKDDPGPYFPWETLYKKYGIGAWYENADKIYYESEFIEDNLNDHYFIESVQKDLAKYGYEISISGKWDNNTKNILKAFQMHFRPKNYDGILDKETWAILKSLIKKYKLKS